MNKTTAGVAAAGAAILIGAVAAFSPETNLSRSLGEPERQWNGIYTPFIADDTITIPLSNIMLKSDSGEMLSGYVLTDDVRLTDARQPVAHAVSHKSAGNDPISPGDIGAMSTAPSGGKSYLATGSAWTEYAAPGIPAHSQLSGRSAADQHPKSSITGLESDLTAIQNSLSAKAPLASPALTGTPTAPTAALSASNSQIATTQFVKNQGYITTGEVNVDLTGYVQTSRTISTTAPLTGGGNLTANRTIGIADATTSTKGAVQLSSATNSTSATLAATPAAVKAAYDLAASKAGTATATTSANGLMAAADKTKLNGIAAGAQVNTVASVAGRTGAVVLSSSDVGLGNVNNTTDANKPISTATQTALNAKAPLANPTFTGAPKGPTAAAGTNTTQFATTAFVQTAIASSAGAIVGEVRLLPFRKADLPSGWYYPSGDYFALTSVVGKALNALPANYKSDWGIVVSGSTIRLFDPNKFFTGNLGRFFRPVNGSSRLPGSIEGDAIRNITGSSGVLYLSQIIDSSVGTGAMYLTASAGRGANTNNINNPIINFDASRVVPTAAENRPYNVGLTPAVYLGQ